MQSYWIGLYLMWLLIDVCVCVCVYVYVCVYIYIYIYKAPMTNKNKIQLKNLYKSQVYRVQT